MLGLDMFYVRRWRGVERSKRRAKSATQTPASHSRRMTSLQRFRLGIGATLSIDAALGATIVITPPSAANSAGSGDTAAVYDDGHAAAPTGLPQLPDLLRGYAARPPWKVAGIDYAVGAPGTVRFKDPLSISLAGTSVDAKNHLIRVNKDNVTLDGYDFSLHGGYGVYISDGANNVVVSHSKFVVGANNVVPINAMGDSGNLAVVYSTIDGGATTDNGNSNSIWALINYNGSGNFVAEYDLLANAPADAIDFSNGTISASVKYNLVTSLGHGPGSHPDFVQFVGSVAHDSVIAFNTIYQPQGSGAVTGMQGIQISASKGAHLSSLINTLVFGNTIIATGPKLTMSCSIAVGADDGNVVDGVWVHDNYLDFRGAYYPFYPPSGRNISFSRNVNMVTGQLVPAPLPRKQSK